MRQKQQEQSRNKMEKMKKDVCKVNTANRKIQNNGSFQGFLLQKMKRGLQNIRGKDRQEEEKQQQQCSGGIYWCTGSPEDYKYGQL